MFVQYLALFATCKGTRPEHNIHTYVHTPVLKMQHALIKPKLDCRATCKVQALQTCAAGAEDAEQCQPLVQQEVGSPAC